MKQTIEQSPIEKGRDFVVAATAFGATACLVFVIVIGMVWGLGGKGEARLVLYLILGGVGLMMFGGLLVGAVVGGMGVATRVMQATTFANRAMVEADDRVELARIAQGGYRIQEQARQHDETMEFRINTLAERKAKQLVDNGGGQALLPAFSWEGVDDEDEDDDTVDWG